MSNLPIQFQDKINSPELLAFLQQFGEETYVDAELINKFRDGINELYLSLNPDRIITIGTETILADEYSYEGYVWQLGGVQFNNTGNPSAFIIPAAATGFRRKDISVFNNEGNIVRIAGNETDGEVASTPAVPPGTLYFKSYDINGNTVEVDPEPPAIDGTQFKQKIENTRWESTQSGTDVVIPFQAAGQMHYSVVNSGLISVAGFSTDNLTQRLYEGIDVLFENQTGNPITLKNMFGGISTPVKFNFGADLVVPNGGKLWLRVRNGEFELIMKSWIDVDLSSKADLVGGKVPAAQLPSYVDDVEEYANLASFPATGETGKIYLALDANKTYRWSGSAYVQIGGWEIYIKNISVSGGYTVDFNVDTHRLTLTGNTTFSEINLPPVGFSKTITLHINGNFGVVFPASWTQYISGAYNGTAPLNTIVIETIGTERKVQISQPN